MDNVQDVRDRLQTVLGTAEHQVARLEASSGSQSGNAQVREAHPPLPPPTAGWCRSAIPNIIVTDDGGEIRIQTRSQTRASAEAPPHAQELTKQDKRYNALNALYKREKGKLEAFRNSLSEWKKQEPEAYAVFHEHGMNVVIASPAAVRQFDMLAWMRAPDYVGKPLRDVQKHYHDEANKRFKLAQADNHQDGYLYTVEDEKYAVDHLDNFGHETKDEPNVFQNFVPRWGGPGALEIMLAQLKVRLIRLEHADLKERYGAKSYKDSLDRRVDVWISEATKDMDKMLPLQDLGLVQDEKLFAEVVHVRMKVAMQSTKSIEETLLEEGASVETVVAKLMNTSDEVFVRSIKEAFKVETKTDFRAFIEWMTMLRQTQYEMRVRCELIQKLRKRRAKHANKLAEIRQLQEEFDDEEVKCSTLEELAAKVAEAVEETEAQLGDRKVWDWVDE